jgi:hypothetical protein
MKLLALWHDVSMPKKSKETARDRARQERERAQSAADRAEKAKRLEASQAAARILREVKDK